MRFYVRKKIKMYEDINDAVSKVERAEYGILPTGKVNKAFKDNDFIPEKVKELEPEEITLADTIIDETVIIPEEISNPIIHEKPIIEQEEKPIHVNRPPSKNTIQESEIFTALDKPLTADDIILSIPGDTEARISEALDAMPNIKIDETSDGSEWVRNISAARYSVPAKGWFTNTVERDDGQFRQSVTSERGKLTAGVPKFNDGTETKLTG